MIVGSGVIGAYLGKKIGDCEIWEKSLELREKPCSGLVSKNIKNLDLDISGLVVNELKGARFFSGNESFEIKKKDTQAYALDRLGLQKQLMEDAKENGCKVLFDKAWNREDDNYIIGADGALSAVAKSCGIKRDYFFTYQVKAELNKRIDPEFVDVYFGDFAPGFFAWFIPYSEKEGEIGLGYKEGNAKEHFSRFSKKFDIKKIIVEQSAPIPVFDPREKTVFDNKALIGDAAAQVKATTGGGIVFGLRCAEILADAVEREDLDYYERTWRKLYEKDLINHLKVRKFIDKADLEDIFRVVREKKVDRLIEEYGDMEHPGKLIKEVLKRPSLLPYFAKLFLSI